MTVVSPLDIRPYPLEWTGGADKRRKDGRYRVPLECMVFSVGNPTNDTESAREERNWYGYKPSKCESSLQASNFLSKEGWWTLGAKEDLQCRLFVGNAIPKHPRWLRE
jgi:hypothetical protein